MTAAPRRRRGTATRPARPPAVFVDRDGTLNREVDYLRRVGDLRVLPGAAAAKNVDLIVTTEKDLVKLEAFPFARGKLVALRLGVDVEDGDDLVTQVIGDAAADVA